MEKTIYIAAIVAALSKLGRLDPRKFEMALKAGELPNSERITELLEVETIEDFEEGVDYYLRNLEHLSTGQLIQGNIVSPFVKERARKIKLLLSGQG